MTTRKCNTTGAANKRWFTVNFAVENDGEGHLMQGRVSVSAETDVAAAYHVLHHVGGIEKMSVAGRRFKVKKGKLYNDLRSVQA